MNAVIYARYSSHNQTEQSIEGQLHDNYAWAKQQGINVIGEYIDRALSGTKDTRPDFQRMITDASKRQFELVIVWKLDRFARNRYDSAIYKAKLKKCGVRVVSVKENITDTPEGIILEGLLESMAEYYSANLSQNILRGKRETMLKGYWCGGKVPYGYKLVERRLVVDEKTAPAIRYLFENYLKGVSKKQIVEDLNAKGYRTASGKPLQYKSFSKTLQNSVYIGQYVLKGEVIPDLAEAIIDEDTFNKVQLKVKELSHKQATYKAKVKYLLSGKIYCGYCGYPMVGECGRSKSGNMYHYYACATKKKKNVYDDMPVCAKKNEKKQVVEDYVIDQTLKYILTPSRINSIAKAVVKEYNKEFSNSGIKELERKIDSYNRELNKLIDRSLEMPKEACKMLYKRMEEIGLQKEDAETKLAKLKIASSIQLTEKEVKSWLLSYCKCDTCEDDLKQNIVDTFISCIYLYDDRIVVFYNVPGGRMVTYEEIQQMTEFPEENRGSDTNPYSGA